LLALHPFPTRRSSDLLLRRGAEDLGAGALRLRAFSTEQYAATPDTIIGAAQGESDVYGLSVEANRGQVVDDRIGRSSCGRRISEDRKSTRLNSSHVAI